MFKKVHQLSAHCAFSIILLLILLPDDEAYANSVQLIKYVKTLPAGATILDTRIQSECEAASLPNAMCLPIESFLAANRRLANFSGVLWKLGSAGLAGDEHVLIIGNNPTRKDFLAGLLILAGQRRISVLDPPLNDAALASLTEASNAGNRPANTRIKVWQEPMRSELIVLHSEMKSIIEKGTRYILDGRTESEYWGQKIHAIRGGHIPGADLNSYTTWVKSNEGEMPDLPQQPVVYATDAFDGLAYFSRLFAKGIEPHVYLDGWARWISELELPIDAATYLKQKSANEVAETQTVPHAQSTVYNGLISWLNPTVWVISVALAFGCGYIVSRLVHRKD